MYEVTETERWTVINGMRTAADTYTSIARECRDNAVKARAAEEAGTGFASTGIAAEQMAHQFDRQAAEAIAIADRVEQAERITVEYDDGDGEAVG